MLTGKGVGTGRAGREVVAKPPLRAAHRMRATTPAITIAVTARPTKQVNNPTPPKPPIKSHLAFVPATAYGFALRVSMTTKATASATGTSRTRAASTKPASAIQPPKSIISPNLPSVENPSTSVRWRQDFTSAPPFRKQDYSSPGSEPSVIQRRQKIRHCAY